MTGIYRCASFQLALFHLDQPLFQDTSQATIGQSRTRNAPAQAL